MSNPFLTKKDPLLEAVQSAMQDGEMRRKAESLVNEEFGVYSRKAVVREDLAAYDARLEEAYKSMKEDTGQADARKTVTSSGKANEKVFAKHKERMKKLADKDYDKDGKIESPKDEVWGSRLRAAKEAGKLKEEEQIDEISGKLAGSYMTKAREQKKEIQDKVNKGTATRQEFRKGLRRTVGMEVARDKLTGRGMTKVHATEETQLDEISKALALKAMKKSDERGEEEYDRDMTADRLSDPKTHWDRAKRLRGHMKRKFGNKTIKTGGTDNLSPKSYEQGGGERRRADKLTKGPRAGKISARHRDKLKDNIKYSLGKHKKPNLPEEAQIDEGQVTGPRSYKGSADRKRKAVQMALGRKHKDHPDWNPRTNPQHSALKLGRKLQKQGVKEESIDEAAYSAKAARAGKDIGKPGKMFSKIASKAGEKYGSEERGKKVAGAILKRIRAKHMKEEHLEEVSAFGKEYSAQRAKLGQGGVYHSKVTGRDIKIQDKSPSKPTSSVSPDKPTTWADPGKRDYSSSNQGVVKPSTSTPPASMATGGTTSMKMPDSLAGRDQAKDVSSAETAVRGIRSYNRGTDTVSPSKYNTPGSAGSATGRSTDLPMDPGAAENAKRKTGSLNEAVQVGEYKYRIV